MKYHILNNTTPLDIDVTVSLSSRQALCAIPPTQNEDVEVIKHDELNVVSPLSLGVSGDLPADPITPMISLGTVRGVLTHTTMSLYYNPLDNLIYLVPDLRRVCGSLELLPTEICLKIICIGGNTDIAVPITEALVEIIGVPGITGGGTAYTSGLDIRNGRHTYNTQSISVPGSSAGSSIRTDRSLLSMISIGNVLDLGVSGIKLPTSVVTQDSMSDHSARFVGHKVIPDDYELVFFLNMF